jgi:hypothetical protein
LLQTKFKVLCGGKGKISEIYRTKKLFELLGEILVEIERRKLSNNKMRESFKIFVRTVDFSGELEGNGKYSRFCGKNAKESQAESSSKALEK